MEIWLAGPRLTTRLRPAGGRRLDRRPIGNEKAPLAIAKWACDLSNAQGEKAEWARHVPGQARSFARQEPAFTMPETGERVTQAELERRGWPIRCVPGASAASTTTPSSWRATLATSSALLLREVHKVGGENRVMHNFQCRPCITTFPILMPTGSALSEGLAAFIVAAFIV